MSPMNNTLSRILKHNNNYSKLERKFFLSGYGTLVNNPYDSYKIPYKGTPVSISVIIPSYNSKKSILTCLKAIEANSYAQKYPSNVQIIVVDDGSTDKTYDFIKNKSFTISVQIIKQKNLYRAEALNTAIAFAKNDYIITCDADMILNNFCLEEFAKRCQILKDSAVLVGFRENTNEVNFSKIKYKTPKFWKDNRFNFDFNLLPPYNMFAETNAFKNLGKGKKIYINSKNGINRDYWNLQRMTYGCLFAASRKFFLKIGGYNNNFKGWGYEDTYIGAMAIANKKFIIPVPAASGFHVKHPIDVIAQKYTGNKKILSNLLLDNFNKKFDFISNYQEKVLEYKELKLKYKNLFFVPKKVKITDDYIYYLGNYENIKHKKYLAESLFLTKNYGKCKTFKNSIYSCFSHIMTGDYDKAEYLYKSQKNIQKNYLDKINIDKLLDTAELWYKQDSFLFAFIDFSLYALYNGFSSELTKKIKICAEKIKKGKTF